MVEATEENIMEQHWIYVRTAAGETAMQQRRRLAHHDLRNVLVQVDGVTSVGALKRRIGDGNLVESSLSELERLRLVEKRWVPEGTEGQGEGSATIVRPTAWRRSEPKEGGWLTTWRERLALWQRRRQARREEKAFLRAYEVNAAEDSFAPVKLKPIRRGAARKNWLARVAGGFLLLLLGLALLLAAFPYGYYRPGVEQRLGAALGETVSIGGIRFNFLPYPSISLSGVAVGAGCQVGTLRVVPSLPSLFGEDWVIEHAQFEDLTLNSRGIVSSARWFSGAGMTLRRAGIERLSVELAGARLQGLKGQMQVTADGRLAKILLRDETRGLRLEATPGKTGYKLFLSGHSVRLPLAPEVIFEYFEARGEIGGDALHLDTVDARLYGGGLAASAVVDWSRGGRLAAEVAFSNASLNRLAKVVSPSFLVEAEMNGKFSIEARAADLAQLGDTLRFEGQFATGRGRLDRFDLMEALRGTRPTRGGYTRFERLSGTLRGDELGLHFGNLRIDAGVLQARGSLDIDRSEVLKGGLELELRDPLLRARTSAAIAGDLVDPQLLGRLSERGGRR